MVERTLAIIKPDAVRKHAAGNIIDMIIQARFEILGLKYVRISKKQAESFYDIHAERPFYMDLVEFMTSGTVVVIALQKENAVADYRKLIGNTDPNLAEEGTVRKLYGESKSYNAVHGSDSHENGEREISFFFSGGEIVEFE